MFEIILKVCLNGNISTQFEIILQVCFIDENVYTVWNNQTGVFRE